MIDRYSRAEMTSLWSAENRFAKWLEIELAACEAWAHLGKIPSSSLSNIKEKSKFDIRRIEEIERTVKHDVIAFLTSVAESVGEDARYIHMGLTSSDILDTSLALLLRDATDILIRDVDQLLPVLKEKAFLHKHTVMIGRSHGIHAEPITFGLKMALWFQEMERARERLVGARESISFGKISGAVGTYSFVEPHIETYVCEKLGLAPEKISTQVIQRDRHAAYFSALAIVASSIDKFATEIRHLQRTEVREAEEYFSKGQKGSSAMPHKRNPVLSENLSGLARLMRSYAAASMENVALWHERDISHSSVERVVAPDATILLDFMLCRFTEIIKSLVIYPENMAANVGITKGLYFSQLVLMKLVDKGISREDAYAMVQKNAMKSYEKKIEFKEALLQDDDVMKYVSLREIEDVFRNENFLRHVDYIFEKVFGS